MSDVDQVVGGINNAMVVPLQSPRCGWSESYVLILFVTNWKLAVAISILIPPVLFIHVLAFSPLKTDVAEYSG